MIKSYQYYLKESKKIQKYKVGDIVWYLSRFAMLSEFTGRNEVTDTLIDDNGKTWYQLKKSEGKSIQWISRCDIYDTKEKFEKAKKFREEEKERIKEEIRRKAESKQKFIDSMKQFDPYGEEDWEDMIPV